MRREETVTIPALVSPWKIIIGVELIIYTWRQEMNKEQSFLSVVFFSCSLHLHVRYARSTYTFSLWVERRNMIVPMMGKEEEGVRCFPQTKPRCLQFANFPRKVSLNTGISSNSRMWETFLSWKIAEFFGSIRPRRLRRGEDAKKRVSPSTGITITSIPGGSPPPSFFAAVWSLFPPSSPRATICARLGSKTERRGMGCVGGKCKNSRIVVIVVVVVVAS